MQKSVPIGAPRGVDIAHVERELAALWVESERLPEPAVTRACSMNLVAVSDRPDRVAEEGEVLGEVSLTHPARIIHLVSLAGPRPKPMSVTVSARCTIPVPGRGQVCSEEIVITGGRRESLFSAVSSLLVPDVPAIVLWRPEVEASDPLLNSLLTVADRLLVDSTVAADPLERLDRWHALMFDEKEDRHVRLAGDLSWTRLIPWRSVLAAAVHPSEMRPLLGSARSLEIEYGGSGLAQAVLYAAWFCSRLGWELRSAGHSGGKTTIVCTAEDSERRISIRRLSDEGSKGLTRVALAGRDGRRVEIRQTEHEGCARVARTHDTTATEELVRYALMRGEAALLVRELELLEHDVVYESAMRWAGLLLERIRR